MITYKLKVKLGDAEFEAEGPEDSVRREYEEWKRLRTAAATPAAVPQASDAAPEGVTNTQVPERTRALPDDQIHALFIFDDAKNLVTLRFVPQGEARASTAMLLILLGYRRLASVDEVPVTLVKAALQRSGLNVDRVDRDAAPDLLKENLVLKGGKGKGWRYGLNNLGVARAEAEAIRLLRLQQPH